MTPKEREFKKLTNVEQRLQHLYREIFYISDSIEQVMDHQKEIGQLLVNLAKEFERYKKQA